MLFTDRPHLRRDFGVTMRRHIREQVMLDLESGIAAHDVQQPVAAEVGAAQQLPHVPLPARIVLDHRLGKLLDLFGKWPLKITAQAQTLRARLAAILPTSTNGAS